MRLRGRRGSADRDQLLLAVAVLIDADINSENRRRETCIACLYAGVDLITPKPLKLRKPARRACMLWKPQTGTQFLLAHDLPHYSTSNKADGMCCSSVNTLTNSRQGEAPRSFALQIGPVDEFLFLRCLLS